MSSKKMNSTSKRMTPSSTSRLNSAVVTRHEFSSASRTHNTTVSRIIRPFPSTDWELDPSFGYNDYLQALMMKELVEEDINKKKIDVSIQLSEKADQLNEAREEVIQLEEETEKLQLKTLLTHLTNTIRSVAERCTDLLSSDVEATVNELILVLQNAQQNLYLKNVKPLESEEEMCKFSELLVVLKNTMEKIITLMPNTEVCHKHACILREYKKLERQLIDIDSSVLKLNNDSNRTLLKVLSDKLSEFDDC